jgi:hypothetical protein
MAGMQANNEQIATIREGGRRGMVATEWLHEEMLSIVRMPYGIQPYGFENMYFIKT